MRAHTHARTHAYLLLHDRDPVLEQSHAFEALAT